MQTTTLKLSQTNRVIDIDTATGESVVETVQHRFYVKRTPCFNPSHKYMADDFVCRESNSGKILAYMCLGRDIDNSWIYRVDYSDAYLNDGRFLREVHHDVLAFEGHFEAKRHGNKIGGRLIAGERDRVEACHLANFLTYCKNNFGQLMERIF